MISKTIGFRGTLFSDTPIWSGEHQCLDSTFLVKPIRDLGILSWKQCRSAAVIASGDSLELEAMADDEYDD